MTECRYDCQECEAGYMLRIFAQQHFITTGHNVLCRFHQRAGLKGMAS